MLNIYEEILKLKNPTLYSSIYKNNICEVGKILNEFNMKSRIIYIKNLNDLKIEKITKEELDKISFGSKSVYDNYNNKILLQEASENKSEINHELFHVSSNKKSNKGKRRSGIILSDNFKVLGKYLNEGITEYLNLKSQKTNISSSVYQLELFIIEFLIFIYGEEFLNYYFQNNGIKFLNYFQSNKNKIKKIDKLLNDNHIYTEIQINRLNCLYLILMFDENKIIKTINFYEDFEMKKQNTKKIYKLMKELLLQINKETIYEKHELISLLSNYENATEIYIDWVIEYNSEKNKIFEKILNYLLTIAYQEGYTDTQIDNFIYNSFKNKSKNFQEMYYKTLNNRPLLEIKKSKN